MKKAPRRSPSRPLPVVGPHLAAIAGGTIYSGGIQGDERDVIRITIVGTTSPMP
jgi:hypothetical protein